ncbi:MAG: Omp28-related outer membrane protein [Crocinitomicaceae bacterium]|nr:Omp28-related outer membrane protein [Crocinitomicaceae bacterium]|tara:strand:+ start:851 stop:1798 length:948 start_codon:yes stop_codon:yes gene_type:complete
MKKLLFIGLVAATGLTSCDKVENIYPEGVSSSELDWSLYPDGDSTHYVDVANAWPTFTANTNSDRNVLIEDFTGHKCVFCPAAADLASSLADANAGRVIVAGIHAGPDGSGPLQAPASGTYSHDFTTTEGSAIGVYFGNDWASSPFAGNPYGAVSRADHGNGSPVTHPSGWTGGVNTLLTANDLKVNIQAEVNYYASTRGVFLHAELDVLDAGLTNELRVVVYLMQDTIQMPQLFPAPTNDSLDYVHKHVMRGTIDGRAFGRELDADHLDVNGKYYFNYSYALPSEYSANNTHLLIYVRDAVTEEVYHVIEKAVN